MQHHSTKVTKLELFAAAAFALGLSLAVFSFSAAAADKITVGTGADPGFSHFYVAKEGGFWQKRGLDVDVKLFPSGAASFSSIIAGDIVAAVGGGTGCILAAARSPKVVLAASSYESNKFYGLVARKQVRSAQELKGKTLATAMGSDAEFYAEEFLKLNNMPRDDVRLINLDAPEMLAALDRGDIDAYTAWEPWLTRAQETLGDKIVVLPRSRDFFYNHNWFCLDRDWAKTEQAQRFMQGLLDADSFMRENPDAAATMTARFLKITPAFAKQIMSLATFDIVINNRTINGLVKTSDWLVSKGKIKPLDYKAFVYPDLLRKVKPEAVSFELPGG